MHTKYLDQKKQNEQFIFVLAEQNKSILRAIPLLIIMLLVSTLKPKSILVLLNKISFFILLNFNRI